MTTGLYVFKHTDTSIRELPEKDGTKRKWLLLTVRDGKTGIRMAHTLEDTVAAYARVAILSQSRTRENATL
jgi:hypothetical protein